MGVKKLGNTANIIAGSVSQDSPIAPAQEDRDIVAIDANSYIYQAYDKIRPTVCNEQGITSQTSAEIIPNIVAETARIICEMVDLLKPKILVIVFDGVPPAAKIMEQRLRRMDVNPNDLLDSEGNIVFSTSWLCPNSYLMQAMDEEFLRMPAKGTYATIYSGPGIAGEGEHKIYPILQSICRYGMSAIPNESKKSTAVGDDWRPKSIYIFGNDNDFFILSALFLSTFAKNAPTVHIYNDFKTRSAASDDSTEIARGPVKLSAVGDLKMFDIEPFLNAIVGTGQFGAPGKTRISKMLHFVHLSCLLGNDFLPRLKFSTDDEAGFNLTVFLQTILNATTKTGNGYLPTFGEIVPEENDDAGTKGRKQAPKIVDYLPLESSRDDQLDFISYHNDYSLFMQNLQNIAAEVNQNWAKITSLPGPNDAEHQDLLIAMATMNNIDEARANEVAVAAACEYLRMMDNVLSYYVTSCCIIPKRVTIKAVETMPLEYYNYGAPPPSFNYLILAAQLLHKIQAGDFADYKKTAFVLDSMSMGNVSFAKPATSAPFLDMRFQSAIIFPGRSKAAAKEQGQTKIFETASYLATTLPYPFPTKTVTGINCNIFPVRMLLACQNVYMQVFGEGGACAKLTDFIRVEIGHPEHFTIGDSKYVTNSLA